MRPARAFDPGRRQIGGHQRGDAEVSAVRQPGEEARADEHRVGRGERAEKIADRVGHHQRDEQRAARELGAEAGEHGRADDDADRVGADDVAGGGIEIDRPQRSGAASPSPPNSVVPIAKPPSASASSAKRRWAAVGSARGPARAAARARRRRPGRRRGAGDRGGSRSSESGTRLRIANAAPIRGRLHTSFTRLHRACRSSGDIRFVRRCRRLRGPGLADELLAALTAARIRGAHADPARGDPATAGGSRPPRAGRHAAPARPPPSRSRCSSASDRGAEGGAPPALVLVPTRELATQVAEAVHSYGRGPRRAGAADLRRSAHRPPAAARPRARGGRRRRHARPRARPHPPRGRCRLRRSRPSCSTRPTRCSTWASPTTSRRSCPTRPATARPSCSRRRCRRASTPSSAITCNNPVRIQLGGERHAPGEAPKVRQSAYIVPRAHKPAALGRLLDLESPTAAIVFCRTRDEVDTLTETLNGRGYRAEALHGGMTQEQRDARDGPAAGRDDRVAGGHRRRRPRPRRRPAHPRRQLRRAGRAGGLRAPHRPCRPCRARGRRDHARPAARAPHAQGDRADHAPDDRDREGPDGRRPARPPPGGHAHRAGRDPAATARRRWTPTASSSSRWARTSS